MFSERTPASYSPNRLTRALEARRRSGLPFIDLTESNPTRAAFDYPLDLLAPLSSRRSLRYDPSPLGSACARQAIAREYDRHGTPVAPDRLVLTASTSEAYSVLFKLLANPGDEALVPRPSYPLLDHLAGLDAVTLRSYDLDLAGAWAIDFDSLERALTPRTRMVLVVSPNNPTGSLVTPEELDRLASLCAPREIAVVADEVFLDYEIQAGVSRHGGRVQRQPDILSFAMGGLSKTVGLPQVKLAWFAVSGPKCMVDPALERLEFICDSYLSVSTPVQHAAVELLDHGQVVRRQIAERISSNYQALTAAVAGVPACRVYPSQAGWYAVLEVPSLEPEEDLVVRLLEGDGVLTHPGFFFDFPRESFLIISLLPPEATLLEGVTRILRHFTCSLV